MNSLLFASYGLAKRMVTPFGELSLPQIALAGGIAGAANAVLSSPGQILPIATRQRDSADPDL